MRYNQDWSYHNPVNVIFGPGTLDDLATHLPIAEEQPGSGLIVTSAGFTVRGLTEKIKSLFKNRPLEIIDDVRPNPDISAVEAYLSRLRGKNIKFIIGIGGGSVLDTAKTLSYLLNISDPRFSLKAHFTAQQLLPETPPLQMVAVPTTAGTGSEVTPFATIWDMANQKKYSLARPDLFPSTALLDPELTLTLPEEITVTTALDVLSHALESVWNHNASPLTLNLAARAVDLVLSALPRILADPQNLDHRSQMLTASLFGGICISSTRTALAHSMSYPITAALGAPHGLACGFTLQALLEFNTGSDDDGRFKFVARMAGFDTVQELSEKISEVYELAGVKDLMAKYKITAENILNLTSEMFTPERAGNNLRIVNPDDVKEILKSSF